MCSLLCDGERTALWHANERFCIHPPVRVDPELEKKGKSLQVLLRYCSTKAKNNQVCPREPRAMPSLWWHLLPLAVPVHARAGVDVNGSHVILELSAPYPVGLARLSAPASRAVRGARGSGASSVQLAVPSGEWRRLEEAGASVELIHHDASDFYHRRAAADQLEPIVGAQSFIDESSAHDDESSAGASSAWRRHTRRQLAPRREPFTARGPTTGTMGGFLTLDQLDSEMSRLNGLYPRWLSAPISVGKTRQSREIKAYCITEGLQSCEKTSSRPTVMYTALVHAREPATLACLLHFVRTLLERAESGDVAALGTLATRKLILLPVANPDGYAWNERSHPHGGGMKRKNGLNR